MMEGKYACRRQVVARPQAADHRVVHCRAAHVDEVRFQSAADPWTTG
jgi:hypothetical protein